MILNVYLRTVNLSGYIWQRHFEPLCAKDVAWVIRFPSLQVGSRLAGTDL